MSPPTPSGTEAVVLPVVRALGYALVAVAAASLCWYLRWYARRLLTVPYRSQWRYLAVGIGAAAVYGLAGLAEVAGIVPATPFRRGATLFVFLFSAVGVRAIHRSIGGPSLVPDRTLRWLGPLVVAGFVGAWWGLYLLASPSAVAALEVAGLVVTTGYTLYHAVGTVRREEGTSIAAVTRQFVPALLALAVVAVADHAGTLGLEAIAVAEGVALVGTVLAGSFLVSTAVAIRQQGGEVERLYDPTTWRGGRAERPSADAEETGD